MSVEQIFKPNTAVITSYSAYQSYTTSAISTDTERYVVLPSDAVLSIDKNSVGKYSVFDVANWFLQKDEMTQKKVQKLCYYAQAWCYALKGYRLIDTDFQAWVHGPVSPPLWERFKCFGYDPICIKGVYQLKFDADDITLLEDVWDTYGESTGNELEVLTHREMPWIEARKGYEPEERCTVVISPDTMASYYKSIYSGD
jgi:uncharacterized phage-associated protein